MFFWRKNPLEEVVNTLHGMIDDLRNQLEAERENHNTREKDLLDRIMVLTNPADYREFRRKPSDPRADGMVPLPMRPVTNMPGEITYDRPITRPSWVLAQEERKIKESKESQKEAAADIAAIMKGIGSA